MLAGRAANPLAPHPQPARLSRQTANGTNPVSAYLLKRQLTLHGVSLDGVRADRVLGEALASGADPLHLIAIFRLSEATALKYATLTRRLLAPGDREAALKARPPHSQR
ncbi:hypothetical protein [Streptomyces sp. NBC_00338]|uniref:hypothetical protein n=1 Tax=Streptomyces sp. NBC_00338 TaxID=2975715 RepID=UPI00225359CA|nr:hypothetical protein [Streptomyces sp. NBC_00338]MCX5138451.1 hypothetical protein [Streptomyces sp. NBC_00338]